MTDQETEYFSEEGLAKLKDELNSRKTKVRREIADRLEFAKSLGDLSENSEYQEAKESQMMNESKIVELEDVLRRAVLVGKNGQKNKVNVGSQVVVATESGKEVTFNIVGSQETSPSDNKISNESPLGRALLGHKKEEIVDVRTPKGNIKYKIIDIN
ncbi:transcription elongation factor GreA [Candidatus Giovannonibacteria bacterium]|nr:transcription elongation factor GreA [Candidatus Giovannonibacteria bacterium]